MSSLSCLRNLSAITAFLLSLLLAPQTYAQAECSGIFDDNGAYLYVVEHANGHDFLLGTHHALSLDSLPGFALAAFDSAKAAYFEISMDSDCISQLQALTKDLYIDRTGVPLRDRLSKPAWEILEDQFAQRGHDLSSLPLSPTGAYVMWMQLTMNIEGKLDLELANRTRQAGRQVLGLETAERHMQVFKGLTIEELEKSIMWSVQNNLSEYIATQARVFKSGSEGEIERMLQEFAVISPQLNATSVNQRNLEWLPTLLQVHQQSEHPTIFALGLFHLIGENGLVALLKAKGFNVRRIQNQQEYEALNLSKLSRSLHEKS